MSGREHLREIGRLLVLDVLINNGDRFPLLWENRGNPGNLMFDSISGKVRVPAILLLYLLFYLNQVIAIDSQLCPIDRNLHEDVFQAYLSKVRYDC